MRLLCAHASPLRTSSLAAVIVALLWIVGPNRAAAGLFDDIGYTQLQSELGAATPTGAGISVSQIEGSSSSSYVASASYPDFAGKTFTLHDGPSSGNNHATNVGMNLYGNTQSIAPGITNIDAWDSYDWLNSAFLHVAPLGSTTSIAPAVETDKIENHSWVGSLGNQTQDLNALLRFDYMVARDNVVSVVAANNGSSNPLPSLLIQSYNAISVGLSNGNHSAGLTTLDGSGRTKPDIVVPQNATSYATPVVSAAAALLLNSANAAGMTDATNSQVVKSILMAGATTTQFPNWTRTPTQPLDAVYGAGQLNVDRSYHILASGEQHASATAPVTRQGWDFNSIASGTNYYYFDVAKGTSLSELSAMLVWQPSIVDANPSPTIWAPQMTLANLSLSLYSANGFTLGSLLDSSVSTVDNLQHVYFNGGTNRSLPAGRYALAVSSAGASTPYALAWLSNNFVIGDMNGDGVLDNFDISAFELAATNPAAYLAVYPTLTNYLARGDVNQDGKFDNFDVSALAPYMNGLGVPTAVPEPSSLALLGSALATSAVLALVARRRVALRAFRIDLGAGIAYR